MATIDTGLGWSADSDYLHNEAGEWLCDQAVGRDSRRYDKVNGGYAVCVYSRGAWGESEWWGPVLISTEPDNVKTHIYGPFCDVIKGDQQTASYAGMTWYVAGQWHFPDSDISSFNTADDLVNVVDSYFYNLGSFALAVLKAAKVRTDRHRAFMAGLACGLASETWPVLEV